MTYAPHYPTFVDCVRQKSIEAKKLKQECFCLFHFRRGYFGFIIQCKVESVSKKTKRKRKPTMKRRAKLKEYPRKPKSMINSICGSGMIQTLMDIHQHSPLANEMVMKNLRKPWNPALLHNVHVLCCNSACFFT
jgi:hypothetical protein